MDKRSAGKLKLISSMLIWGSLGLFIRGIDLPSSVIANFRGFLGAVFLLLVILLAKLPFSRRAVRENAVYLGLSGLMLGFNWILLFEAYRYTTIAVATLCYYLAPIIVVAVSPLVFKERLGPFRILCVLAALIGMVFVSGAAEGGLPSPGQAKGIVLALGAALLYAAIVISNKKMQGISGLERTVVQLGISALVLLPYNLFTVQGPLPSLELPALLLLLAVGIIHTGLAYFLYFGCMEDLPSQTVAILAYVDPVTAVLLSALVLKEPMSAGMWLGAALVIAAAVLLELPVKKNKK
ncbi:MAG: EamA family transporter [Oscillospiraceae bacterium]